MLQRYRAHVQVGLQSFTGKETASSYSGPTPHSLDVWAAFFCDQARSNWDPLTSATQFHCPKLYSTIHRYKVWLEWIWVKKKESRPATSLPFLFQVPRLCMSLVPLPSASSGWRLSSFLDLSFLSIRLWDSLPASALSQRRGVSPFRSFLHSFYNADTFFSLIFN